MDMRPRHVLRRARLDLAAALTAAARRSLAADAWEPPRRRMVARISHILEEGSLGGRSLDPRVLAVMGEVPRHLFVPEHVRSIAYEDTPLPIGHGSTISQPFMVALMTSVLRVRPGQELLEVGTGSGYQAAILSRLGAQIFTVEIVEPLAREAARRLKALEYRGVQVRTGDGYKGWPAAAPFDGVMVTAGATHVPRPLVDQLKAGGRLVIPVGSDRHSQELLLLTKAADGRVTRHRLGSVAFIPLDERARPH